MQYALKKVVRPPEICMNLSLERDPHVPSQPFSKNSIFDEAYHKPYTSTVTFLKGLCTILGQSHVLVSLSKSGWSNAFITQTLNLAAAIYLTV